jgi:hypothetical protein
MHPDIENVENEQFQFYFINSEALEVYSNETY